MSQKEEIGWETRKHKESVCECVNIYKRCGRFFVKEENPIYSRYLALKRGDRKERCKRPDLAIWYQYEGTFRFVQLRSVAAVP